jgi:K(+)-stimulated pyrophosphate-energized sodium pump
MQDLNQIEQVMIWAVVGVAILGLLYAVFLRAQVLREDMGTLEMQKVWNAIKTGAEAYLNKQARSIIPLIAVLTVIMFLSVYVVPPTQEAIEHFSTVQIDQVKLIIGSGRAVAFVRARCSRSRSASSACAWRCKPTCAWRPRRATASAARCASPIARAPSLAC